MIWLDIIIIIIIIIIILEKFEEALVSNHPDTLLYELIKFLLQAIFVAMEDEHESTVELEKKKRSTSPTDKEQESNGKGGESTASQTGKMINYMYMYSLVISRNLFCECNCVPTCT